MKNSTKRTIKEIKKAMKRNATAFIIDEKYFTDDINFSELKKIIKTATEIELNFEYNEPLRAYLFWWDVEMI